MEQNAWYTIYGYSSFFMKLTDRSNQIKLNAEQWTAFQAALDAQPRPMPRMKKLMQEAGIFDSSRTDKDER
jgi:hypothetical protein